MLKQKQSRYHLLSKWLICRKFWNGILPSSKIRGSIKLWNCMKYIKYLSSRKMEKNSVCKVLPRQLSGKGETGQEVDIGVRKEGGVLSRQGAYCTGYHSAGNMLLHVCQSSIDSKREPYHKLGISLFSTMEVPQLWEQGPYELLLIWMWTEGSFITKVLLIRT